MARIQPIGFAEFAGFDQQWGSRVHGEETVDKWRLVSGFSRRRGMGVGRPLEFSHGTVERDQVIRQEAVELVNFAVQGAD